MMNRDFMEWRGKISRTWAQLWPFSRGAGLLGRIILPHGIEIPPGRVIQLGNGIQLKVYPGQMPQTLLKYGLYEPAQTRIYRKLVDSGDTVFDIGANFGWFTLQLGLIGCRVHAFEPLPSMFGTLEKNVKLNHLEGNIRLQNLALGRQEGRIVIFTFRGLLDAQGSATDLGRSDAEPHVCPVSTLDDYVHESGVSRITFLKCDVEGHEQEVFQGGATVLSRSDSPIIGFEINTTCLEHRGVTPGEVQSTLQRFGYTRFFSMSATNLFGATLHEIHGALPHRDCDYLAIKPVHAKKIEALIH